MRDEQTDYDPNKPCCCLPGQCRGQVVSGKLPNGDICKQEFAKNMWFYWDRATLPTSPALAGKMQIEWKLLGEFGTHSGEARDPVWDLPAGDPRSVNLYRWIDPRVMLLNPYSGKLRDPIDIMQDPEGRLVSQLPEPASVPAMPPVVAPKVDEASVKEPGDSENVMLRLPKQVIEVLSKHSADSGQLFDDLVAEVLRQQIETADVKAPAFSAPDLLDAAAGHMRDRAKTYDKPEGERSMAATVEAFNAITGRDLRESEGWLLMSLLKMVRSETRDTPHRDSVEDLVAYCGLYGEARLGGA